jgi:hypothetical protein
MKVRMSLALVACLVGASLITGSAAANRPEKSEFSPVGDRIDCVDDTLVTQLTISSGVVVERIHEHELPSGRTRILFVDVNRHVTAEDEEETVYRVVGTVKGNFTTFHPEDEDPEDAIGFLKVNLNIIGPGGLLGKVKFSERTKRNGDTVVRAKGNCDFVG